MSNPPHEARTAQEPRQAQIHAVIVERIQQVTFDVRLVHFRKARPADPIKFLAGQWLDVHIPGLPQAGGFTITSTPEDAQGVHGHLELAIQHSPRNPPAAWLWQKQEDIVGQTVLVRAGGAFTWPPPNINVSTVQRLLFVAGGVGINPLMSMLSHLDQSESLPEQIRFLYATRAEVPSKLDGPSVLFLPRLRSILEHGHVERQLHVFLTRQVTQAAETEIPSPSMDNTIQEPITSAGSTMYQRRFNKTDLEEALGPLKDRSGLLSYVCGPPAMTDWAVDTLRNFEGVKASQVLCEKWW